MLRVLILVAAGSVVLAGCSGPDEPAGPSAAVSASPSGGAAATTSSRPDPHALFDPCTALTKDWLAAHGFEREARKLSDEKFGEVESKGCLFTQKDETYDIGVYTLRYKTLDMVRAGGFTGMREFTVGNRKAIIHRSLTGQMRDHCTSNIEVRGGVVKISLDKLDYDRKIPDKDPCELAETASREVAALFPTSL